jgi:hypothetical protein
MLGLGWPVATALSQDQPVYENEMPINHCQFLVIGLLYTAENLILLLEKEKEIAF